MKKSKKLMMIKRTAHCVSCKYSKFYVYSCGNIEEMGFCLRHNDSYCYAFNPCCPHYVPFNDVLPPHKFLFYWIDVDDSDLDELPF